MIKWIFFDVGSTLVDEHLAYEHRFRDIASDSGESFETIRDTAMEFYRRNKKGDLETAKKLGVVLTKWHGEDEVLYPDAADCLKKLHGRYKLGIIANQSPGTAERLERFGILQYIDLVIASAEEGVAKPDPRIFEIALERAGCRPNEAVMVGDRIDNDIIPANLLGMPTVWIRQGSGRFWNVMQKIEQADWVVDTLSEVAKLF